MKIRVQVSVDQFSVNPPLQEEIAAIEIENFSFDYEAELSAGEYALACKTIGDFLSRSHIF